MTSNLKDADAESALPTSPALWMLMSILPTTPIPWVPWQRIVSFITSVPCAARAPSPSSAVSVPRPSVPRNFSTVPAAVPWTAKMRGRYREGLCMGGDLRKP